MEIKQEKALLESVQEVRHKLHLRLDRLDFQEVMSLADQLFYEAGLTPIFSIYQNGEYVSEFTISKGVEQMKFVLPAFKPQGEFDYDSWVSEMRWTMYKNVLSLVEKKEK